MFRYLFSFDGRINRAKFWLYWPIALAVETVVIALICVIGSVAKLDDPMDAMFPPLFQHEYALAKWLGSAAFGTFVLFYFWTLGVVSVKRLHDRNKGAIWALFFWGLPILLFVIMSALISLRLISFDAFGFVGPFVATVGGAIMWWGLIEMLFFRGTTGENRFGPDPLALTGSSSEAREIARRAA